MDGWMEEKEGESRVLLPPLCDAPSSSSLFFLPIPSLKEQQVESPVG